MTQVLENISLGIGLVAGGIIVFGVLVGVFRVVRAECVQLRSRSEKPFSFEKIRFGLGSHLLLGLEFLIAADIMRTIVSPTLEQLGILGGLVIIRTLLSYILQREIKSQERS